MQTLVDGVASSQVPLETSSTGLAVPGQSDLMRIGSSFPRNIDCGEAEAVIVRVDRTFPVPSRSVGWRARQRSGSWQGRRRECPDPPNPLRR